MKKICFITGTRADYGIMAPVMKIIEQSPDVELQIIATNMHLSARYGMTVNEIKNDGFKIDFRIESLADGDSPQDIVESMSKVQSGLGKVFPLLLPDLVVILGDRYEALAAAAAAVTFNIPIAHLHGGETTEGAFDDKFRHAITKLSTYHFASTPQYVEKIISMGENPERVFHSGAPGAEIGILEKSCKLVEDFKSKTGIASNEKFILMAIHPVTLSPDFGEADIRESIVALNTFLSEGYKVLVTLPNSDPGNANLRQLLKNWSLDKKNRVIYVDSLGSKLFHYALSKASFMIGNSSAALIEAPSFALPAVNVGIRQKGRAQGPTVINTPPESTSIILALRKALSHEFRHPLSKLSTEDLNPYYKKDSASFIAEHLIQIVKS